MRTPDAVVITLAGENLIDTVSTALPDGEIRQRHTLGGSPYNVAVAMSRQDVEVRYVNPIPTDDFGTRLADNDTRRGRHRGAALCRRRRR
jgi:fructokinase